MITSLSAALIIMTIGLWSPLLESSLPWAGAHEYEFQARLTGEPGAEFANVGVAIEGNFAAVLSVEGVHVYRRGNTGWVVDGIVEPSDGPNVCTAPRDILIQRGSIYAGCRSASIDGKQNQGAVYEFKRNNDGFWLQSQRITAADGDAGDRFGAIYLDGDRLFVGASHHDVDGQVDRGAVYVFTRSLDGWVQEAEINPTDSVSTKFIHRIAAKGDKLAAERPRQSIGSKSFDGEVLVFQKTSQGWQQQAALSVCEPSACCCNFGYGIAMSDTEIAVGNTFLNVGSNPAQGGVYIFSNVSGSWSQVQRLTSTDGGMDQMFGGSIKYQGASLFIGAKAGITGEGGPPVPGSVYVFKKDAAGWSQGQKLVAPEGTIRRNWFGQGIGVDDRSIIVACPLCEGEGSGPFTGSAYIFSTPAAVEVAVSGRVATPDGRGLRNATVAITDSDGMMRTATTSSLGYFSFPDVVSGKTYVIRVSSKRYRFESRQVEVNSDLADVDFTGLE